MFRVRKKPGGALARAPSEAVPPLPEILSAETVEDGELRFLLEHWKRLKGVRAMPGRAELVPKDIRRSLRFVHLYEVEKDDFRARLVGTGVFSGLEGERTGKLISEHPDAEMRVDFARMLAHVAASAKPARSVTLRVTGSVTDMRTEILWLPLGESGSVTHVLAQSSFRPLGP